MSRNTFRSKVPDTVSRQDLSARTQAIRTALEHAGDRLPADQVRAARELETKIGGRTRVAGTRTVVSLAGATGSGKSSLFNALVTEPVSRIGARRPTTSAPAAAIWGEEPSGELLDWLKVGARHHVPASAKDADHLDGLVLLDLPDFDSRVAAHRAEADRVLELSDVFVWVTDPQKYADAVLHDQYVHRMASHSAVTIVVLNQIDRLGRGEVAECAEDLQRLLTQDGLDAVKVISASALRGEGVADLLQAISQAVQTKNAAERRLMADLRAQAARLRAGVADGEPPVDERAAPQLVEALSTAAGVPIVEDAVARDYRMQAAARGGWPFVRWIHRLRPAPLRRVGLDRVTGGLLSRKDARIALGRSSLPTPTPAARAAVDVATRRLGQAAAEGLPQRWADSVYDAASPDDGSLYDQLDQAILATALRERDPWWWMLVWVLQWMFAAVAIAGLVWLLVLAGLGFAQISASAPTWGILPVPLLMLVGGAILGLLLALLARWFAARGARHQARIVGKRLRKSVAAVSGEQIVAPVHKVLRDHALTRKSLDEAMH
ncbi:GTP-binding protein [Leekyejoonella antrihumi]|uniref:ABC transporter n=1 Tax=Leekyejoonella antrihumi TaxID=1660198 RepID=A0A563E571_9MICO|nr:GTP-binding protein [Leekyejoonella antrihumi]TWP37690.1 ABC transporter [Leekyejoonella antrihumi]